MAEAQTATVVADLVKDLHEPKLISLEMPPAGGVPALLMPKGIEALSVKEFFDEYRTAPERRTGTAKHTTLASFVEHVKRFADADSAMFADPTPSQPSLLAVLDYHRAGADAPPRFGKHRAFYPFPVSDEWKAWAAVNDKEMAQDTFAAFVEDRIADIVDPASAGETSKRFAAMIGAQLASPARVMELSRGLQVNVESRVGRAVNLSTGEGQITFTEEHRDETGAPLTIPGAFLLQIPVFRSDAQYQIPVRLRYRVASARVMWRCVLYRADRVFDDAITTACAKVNKETGLPVFMGTPEG